MTDRQPPWAVARAATVLVALAALPLACRDAGGPSADRPEVVTTAGGVRMVRLPGGWFEMGSASEDQVDETPHRVDVGPFDMDVCEVTQREYEKTMGRNPSKWPGPDHPVEQIRWVDAARYANARSRLDGLRPAYDPATWACDFQADGYRLPTEAEWEYACRAGTRTAYFFGDGPRPLDRYAWFARNATRGPQPVGRKEPNAWGLYDLYGNVWEWCHDVYAEDYYGRSPDRDPRGPASGKTRVLRGGGWRSRPDALRSSYRFSEDPAYTDACFARDVSGFVGFRCVRRTPDGGGTGP